MVVTQLQTRSLQGSGMRHSLSLIWQDAALSELELIRIHYLDDDEVYDVRTI